MRLLSSRWWCGLVAASVAAAASLPAPAYAIQMGIVGFSGKQGETCNDDCHSGGTAPLVRFEGPARTVVGALATFRFVVVSQSSKQSVAGFNVATSQGMLDVVPGQGEHVEVDELTHDMPKADINGVASFLFTWRAPDQPGPQTLYGAGLSANNNGNRNGDDSATATLRIAVTPSLDSGDANCDGRLSAADLPAVVRLLPSGTTAGCALADADGDGVVDHNDVELIVASLFEPPAPLGP